MNLSWIQRHALLVLLRTPSARVKELTPEDVPANLFSYHLEGLRSANLIEKTARGTYQLTTEGQILAGSFSTETEKPVKEIKTVIMFYGKKDNKYLLFQWSRQPYLGQTTLPYDRLPFGQTLDVGLQKATREKLGDTLEATYKTSVLVKIMHSDLIVSHMNAVVYEVNPESLTLPFESRNGTLILEELMNIEHMQGINKLIQTIEYGPSISEVILTY